MSTIRHIWVKRHPFPLITDVEERYAEFDRALAGRDTAAWNAGATAMARAIMDTYGTLTFTPPRNPYDEGDRVHAEILEGFDEWNRELILAEPERYL